MQDHRQLDLFLGTVMVNETDDDLVLRDHRWHEPGTVRVWLRTFAKTLTLKPGDCLLYGLSMRVYVQRQDRAGRFRILTWTTYREVQCDR